MASATRWLWTKRCLCSLPNRTVGTSRTEMELEGWGVAWFYFIPPPPPSHSTRPSTSVHIWVMAYLCPVASAVWKARLAGEALAHHCWPAPQWHPTSHDRPEAAFITITCCWWPTQVAKNHLPWLFQFFAAWISVLDVGGHRHSELKGTAQREVFSKSDFYLHLFQSITCMFYFLNGSN